ncbi:MAG TPA: outer membrane beta-barrel protein [Melioribacteraceae bacterium]|nr:outer membrane beta-barrel protein [Melioribacteraceae bacterium]
MKRWYLYLFIIFGNILIAQQTRFITGQIYDKETKETITDANCILIHLPDSTITGTTSDYKGYFIFNNIKEGNYKLKISYIGYETNLQNISFKNKSIDLQKIFINRIAVKTKDVEVVASVLPVIQNADTTEFNADAFKKNKDSDTENLIQKMPGVTVQDGTVKVMGEEVKKVLVDGKTFFGDDPSAVLRNIPSEIVEKIQVFDQLSEQSKFTGFDDGNTSKTMNIVTKIGIKEGSFGKFVAAGNEDSKYKINGNFNLFSGDTRLSVLGQGNNVNEQNFSPEDLMGVMASNDRGGRRGEPGGFRGGPPRGGMFGGGRPSGDEGRGQSSVGSDPTDFLVNQKNGSTKTYAAGINYADKYSDNIVLSSSYFYNITKNDAQSGLNRFYTFADLNQNYIENTLSSSSNVNHRFNLKMEWTIDSLNSILFKPNLSIQKNTGLSESTGDMYQDFLLSSFNKNIYNSDLTAINIGMEFLFRHRFITKGRTISVGFNSYYNENDGYSKQYSISNYTSSITYNDTINQFTNPDKKGNNYNFSIQYTEPFGENSSFLINYTSNIALFNSRQITNSFSPIYLTYLSIDSLVSNVYSKEYYSNNAGIGYRYQKNDFRIIANINYNSSKLINDQNFPYNNYLEKSFYSFLPSITLRYNFTKDMNINVNYRTNNTEPSIEQLQNVLNNSNSLQLSIGNPNLIQNYRHNLSLRYSIADIKCMQSFFVMLNGSLINDYVGNDVYVAPKDTIINNIILNKGVQLTIPKNMNGYENLRSFIAYGYMWDLIKSNINLNLSFSYTKTPSILNNEKMFAKSVNYGLGFVISSNISENLDFIVSSNSSFTDTKYTSSSKSDNHYFNENIRSRVFWQFWEGFNIETDINYQFYKGLSSSYNNNYCTWNIGIGKKFLKNNAAEIKFMVYDILNQNNNVQRNISDSYYEDTTSNVLSKYYLLTFSYNLKAFN